MTDEEIEEMRERVEDLKAQTEAHRERLERRSSSARSRGFPSGGSSSYSQTQESRQWSSPSSPSRWSSRSYMHRGSSAIATNASPASETRSAQGEEKTMNVSKKKLAAGLVWAPLGVLLLGHAMFVRPVVLGLPFGGVLAEIVFWALFLPLAVSLIYALTMVLFGAVIGVLICVVVIAEHINTSWLEGDVAVPTTPQRVVSAMADGMNQIVAILHAVSQTVVGWVLTEEPEPTELEKVREAYAQGELSDLEMEQRIGEVVEDED